MTMSDASPSGSAELSALLNNLLNGLPPPTAHAIRMAALPYTPTDEQLALLLAADQPTPPASAVTVAEVKAALAGAHLARAGEGALLLQPILRDSLLIWWRQTAPARFRELNQLLLDGLRSPALSSPDPRDPAVAYQWLSADEEAGRRFLLEAMEAAFDYYQLAQAEDVMAAARSLSAWLTPTTRVWLDYYGARLALESRQGDCGAAIFEQLATDGTPDLQAVARWSWGQLLVQTQNWQQGLLLQRAALAALPAALAPLYRARILLTIGDAYRDLAEYSGGLAADPTRRPPHSPAARFAELPFLYYRRLVRRFSFLPNWYFGGNYEDWVIAYLRKRATRWYRRAEQEAKSVDASPLQLNAALADATLRHRLGRWRQAHRLLRRLEQHSLIQNSRYRKAKLQQSAGEALAVEHNWHAAVAQLVAAAETWRAYTDVRALALTQHWLARVERVTAPARAVATYTESARHYAAVGDLATATLVVSEVEDTLPGQEFAAEIRALLPTLHYLTRFPAAFLRRARRLALFIALPVSLAAGLLLTTLATISLGTFLEGIIQLLRTGASFAALTPGDALILILFTCSPVLALWLYHGLYCGLGYAAISFTGRDVTPIEREPPDRIMLTAEHLTYVNPSQATTTAFPWTSISAFVAAEFHWRRQTIRLFSRLWLADHTQTAVTIQAVTIGYGHFRRELVRRVGDGNKTTSVTFDFNIAAPRAIAATLLLTALRLITAAPNISTESVGVLQPDGTFVNETVYFAPWLREFVIGFLLIFLLVTLWRLVWRRRQWRRVAPELAPLTPTWLLWLAALVQTALVLLTWFGLRPA